MAVLALYSLGAHGIMTLNDFKSVEGDRTMGIDSLPVLLGPDRAARLACLVMGAPQAVVVALLLAWGRPWFAVLVGVLLAVQVALMVRFLREPRRLAPWYNGTGTLGFVLGMLAVAFALRGGA
jgi:chlorophyll synthase